MKRYTTQKKNPKKTLVLKNQKYGTDRSSCGKRKLEEANETCDISDDVKELTSYFRKLLSGRDPPIQQVIDCGVVPCLIRFLQFDDNPALQLEAAGSLTVIAGSKGSEKKNYLIEVGVVPILIRLLSSMNEDVRLQAARALGNLAGYNYDKDVKYRDIILAEGALPALIQAAEDCDESLFRAIAYALSNLCSGEPGPDLLVIEPALPLLARLLSSQDVETVSEACRALSFISAEGDNGIQTLIEADVVPQLVELLKCSITKILSVAIRTIANITKGRNTSQIQLIMSYDVLPCLLELLDHRDGDIRKDVCNVIANLACDSYQIQAMIDTGLFSKLFELTKLFEDIGKEEAVSAVYNSTLYSSPLQVCYLVDVGVIPALFNLLANFACGPVVELLRILEVLEKILRLNQSTLEKLQIITRICDCGGMDVLQSLRKSFSRRVTSYANSIMEMIFDSHLLSDDPKEALTVEQYYLKILGIEKNPPIQQVIDCGVIPFLIRFLQMDDNADLQLEATGAITKIALSKTSEHRKQAIEAGVVPMLIRLLSSMNEDVRLQAARALGNLASVNYDKDVKYRDIILAEGALPALIQTTENRISEQIIYAISHLCDGKPFPDFEVIRPALPLLRRCLDSENEEVMIYSLVSLGRIARSKDSIHAILDKQLNIIARFIELLGGCTSSRILKQVVFVLGQIACSNKIHAQSVLATLPSFLWLLDHPDKEVRFNICWTLSKIIAGTKEHIQAVIDAAIFPKLIELLKSEDTKIQKRIALIICRATKRGTSDQVWYLINEGVISPLCQLLEVEL